MAKGLDTGRVPPPGARGPASVFAGGGRVAVMAWPMPPLARPAAVQRPHGARLGSGLRRGTARALSPPRRAGAGCLNFRHALPVGVVYSYVRDTEE